MPSQFDIAHTAAAIYAESLLQLASEAGQAEAIGQELRELKELWKADPAFAAMMSSAAIEAAARGEIIRKAFAGRIQKFVLNLLLVLNDKRRSMILPAVCDAYRRKLDRQMNREQVFVTTVSPLSEQQRDELRGEIKRLTGHDADLIERVDPEVLGGMTVQAAEQVFDLSVRRRIRGLRGAVLAAIDRHLLSGGVARFVAEAKA